LETLEEAYKVLQEQLIDIINQHNLRPALLREVYARLEQVAVQLGLSANMPQPPSPLGRDVEDAASPYAQQPPKQSPGQAKQQQQQAAARDVLGRPISSRSSSYPDVLDHDLGHSTRQDQQHAVYAKQQQQQQQPYPHQQQQAAAHRSPDRKPAVQRGGARRDTDVLDVGAPAVPAAAALMQAAPLQPQQKRRGGFKVGGAASHAPINNCACVSRHAAVTVAAVEVWPPNAVQKPKSHQTTSSCTGSVCIVHVHMPEAHLTTQALQTFRPNS
jgi:hypothetical protein